MGAAESVPSALPPHAMCDHAEESCDAPQPATGVDHRTGIVVVVDPVGSGLSQFSMLEGARGSVVDACVEHAPLLAERAARTLYAVTKGHTVR